MWLKVCIQTEVSPRQYVSHFGDDRPCVPAAGEPKMYRGGDIVLVALTNLFQSLNVLNRYAHFTSCVNYRNQN